MTATTFVIPDKWTVGEAVEFAQRTGASPAIEADLEQCAAKLDAAARRLAAQEARLAELEGALTRLRNVAIEAAPYVAVVGCVIQIRKAPLPGSVVHDTADALLPKGDTRE